MWGDGGRELVCLKLAIQHPLVLFEETVLNKVGLYTCDVVMSSVRCHSHLDH